MHGQLTSLSGGMSDVPTIDQAALEAAVADGRLQYVGLGDRHSTTEVTDRIWFSGTQEVTAPEETHPGNVLKVTLSQSAIDVEPIRVGAWHMVEHHAELYDEESLTALEDWFAELPDKERTYVRLAADGSLPPPAAEPAGRDAGRAGRGVRERRAVGEVLDRAACARTRRTWTRCS